MGARLSLRSIDGRRAAGQVEFTFDQPRILIGRSAGAEIRIPHRTVSERHALLEQRGEGYALSDQGSTNGTRVNGEVLVQGRAKGLSEGDLVQLGVYQLSFHLGAIVTEALSTERTAELARRLLREGTGAGLAAPRLVVLDGEQAGESVELAQVPCEVVVGRGGDSDLVLQDEDVSREHAKVVRDGQGGLIRDLGSKNGLLFEDRPMAVKRLRDGDELRLGQTRLLFEDPAHEPLQALSAEPDEALPQDYSASAPQAPEPTQAPEPSEEAEQALRPAPQTGKKVVRPGLDADVIIYILAALILGLSLAGIFYLVRAG